jgi:hypothetical protein
MEAAVQIEDVVVAHHGLSPLRAFDGASLPAGWSERQVAGLDAEELARWFSLRKVPL